MGRKLSILLLVVLALTVTACGKPRMVTTIDMEKAQIDLSEYCKHFPTSKSVGEMYICDVTCDGIDDVVTSVTYGNNNTHSAIVVYDVYNEDYYTLDGEYFGYSILKVDKDCLFVIEDDSTKGTVGFEENELVFIANN